MQFIVIQFLLQSSIIKEFLKEKHEILLFTLEDEPEDLPFSSSSFSDSSSKLTFISLNYLLMPAYPNKKVAKPEFLTLYKVFLAIKRFQPDFIHITSDGISQIFSLVGYLLNIPVVGSFHTDILDLLSTHNAIFFQKWSILFKETVDSYVLDSCATTSESFAVRFIFHSSFLSFFL